MLDDEDPNAPAGEATEGAPQPEGSTDAPTQPETTGDAAAEAVADPPAQPDPPKPSKGDRRFAHLQARASEAQRRADAAEQELAAARDLIRQYQGGTNSQGQPGNGTQQLAPTSDDQILARAQQIVAEERVREKRQLVIDAGVKAHGVEAWNAATSMVHTMGALAKPEFMESLVELPPETAQQIVAHLADDPDQLKSLLEKRPAAMATAIGRLAEQIVTDKPKEISRVAAPVRPVGAGRAVPEKDPSKMSAAEFIKYRNQTAPRHLGGQGKAV
jgi:hypothetical protein